MCGPVNHVRTSVFSTGKWCFLGSKTSPWSEAHVVAHAVCRREDGVHVDGSGEGFGWLARGGVWFVGGADELHVGALRRSGTELFEGRVMLKFAQ